MNNSITPIFRPGGFEITDRAIELCGFKKGDKLLDIGCGTGTTVKYLRDKYGFDMTGLDKSSELIEIGKKTDNTLNLIVGDGCRLPFDIKSFDGALMECSLSLMPNKQEAIHEAYCMLKNGGCLIVHGLYIRQLTQEQTEKIIKIKEERKKPKDHCMTDAEIAALDTCTVGGALYLDGIMEVFNELDFEVIKLEDRSDDLKKFVGEVILRYGSLADYAKVVCDSGACCYFTEMPKNNTGYFLLVVRKP